MRSVLRLCTVFTVLFFIIPAFMPGCSIFLGNLTSEEVEKQIKEAREHFEVVKSLEVEESYRDDFAKAETAFAKAENFRKWNRPKAYAAAKESLEASKRILRKFYLETVSDLAKKARQELKKKIGEDDDNPLTDYVPKLDKVIAHAESVEKYPQIVSLNKVLDDLKEILSITYSIQTSMAETLESDVSFGKGKYELSDGGKQVIKEIVERIISEKKVYLNDNPGKTIRTKIKVVGYTDQLNFARGGKLERELLKKEEEPFPRDRTEQRRFLNQRLSEFRTKTIIRTIEKLISKSETETSRFKIDTDAVGRGEKMPANLPPPYPTTDSRRRICKIYTYTTIY